MVVYDIEIINPPIPDPKRKNTEKYTIANGWEDYVGMGIACVWFYSYITNGWFLWTDDKPIDDLCEYVANQDMLIGYNNNKFDDNVFRAHSVDLPEYKSWDILRNFYLAKGLGDKWDFKTHGGYSLDKMIKANVDPNIGKTGSGKDAPYDWQDGKYQHVIDYCRSDVDLTKQLLNKIFETGGLIDCKSGKFIKMGLPFVY